MFLIFTLTWRNDPIWLIIFLKWVEITKSIHMYIHIFMIHTYSNLYRSLARKNTGKLYHAWIQGALHPVVVGADNIGVSEHCAPGRFLTKSHHLQGILDFLPDIQKASVGKGVGLIAVFVVNQLQSTQVVKGRVFQSCRPRYNLRFPQSTETSTFYNTTFFILIFSLEHCPISRNRHVTTKNCRSRYTPQLAIASYLHCFFNFKFLLYQNCYLHAWIKPTRTLI